MREGGTVIRAWIPPQPPGAAVAAALVAGGNLVMVPEHVRSGAGWGGGGRRSFRNNSDTHRALHLDLGQLLSWLKGLPREAEPAVGTSPD